MRLALTFALAGCEGEAAGVLGDGGVDGGDDAGGDAVVRQDRSGLARDEAAPIHGGVMRLELDDGKANKFWEAELGETWVSVTFGRVGSPGQKKRHTFATERAAAAHYEKLIAQQKKKGYREVGEEKPAAPGARDAKLEAAVRARRDDQAAYLVYSDFLQSVGDPVGELIAVQLALSKQSDVALTKRSNVLLKKLALLQRDLGTLTFKWGLLESVRIESSRDWTDGTFDIGPALERLFGSAACAVLRELKVGVVRWDEHEEDLQRLFEIAGRFEWSRWLELLHLGDIESVDLAHHSIGAVGRAITQTFPGLRSLILHAGEKHGRASSLDFSGLELPELRQLVIETCSMSKERLASLWAAKLPKLKGLTLWFGEREDYGATATLDDLAPLLEGKVFPHLEHLGLANAAFESELAAALPRSKLAPQLESLDLSMGTLHDGDVPALVAAAKSFKRLQALDVSENFLTDAGVAALAKAYPNVDGADQRELYTDGRRYPSVTE